jgi:hypothetical protein
MTTLWFCDQHGQVLASKYKATPGIDFTVHHFCPSCGRELSRRDALSQLEEPRAASFEEWKQAQAEPWGTEHPS